MIKDAIKQLIAGKDLESYLMRDAMSEIMEGSATPAQIACFLTALALKGETIAEITEAAFVMRKHMVKITPEVEKLIDTCGTGGDGRNTFNISTIVALVLAAGDLAVAKHGNRSVSSRCGSADLLQQLGINFNLKPEIMQKAIEEINFGFLFAPLYHPAMKYATPIRREIGIRTIFNILGPLANPAQPQYQLLGVYDQSLLIPLTEVLKNLGLKKALVVHSYDGLDEISLSAKTKGYLLENGKILELEIEPHKLGFSYYPLEVFQTKSPDDNLEKAKKVLEAQECPETEIVILNAGWAFFVAEHVASIEQGIKLAYEILKKGKAKQKLAQFRKFCNNACQNH